jgi:hypothetical protein
LGRQALHVVVGANFNRLLRLVRRGFPPSGSGILTAAFHDGAMGSNVIAEITEPT